MEVQTNTLPLHYQKYGDRTSSLISLYSHFKSFKSDDIDGEIRFIEKKSAVAIANEPLSPHLHRKNFIQNFFKNSRFKGKDKLAFPISEVLACELKKEGIHVWQIGVEPIFVLADYFADNADVLSNFPIARSLKRRGAKVYEISEEKRIALSEEIEHLKEDWLSSKKLAAFEFLNVVDPLAHEEYKRYFILNDKDQMMALLSASPIFLEGQIVGYFFNDILKRTTSRSATSELLILETMGILHKEGVSEIRLGMCPLAMISSNEKDAKKLTGLYEKWKWGYQFKSLFLFKNKLNPTKWRPLYLASDRQEFSRMITNVLKIHFSSEFILEFFKRNWYSSRRNFELKNKVKKKVIPRNSKINKISFLQALLRVKWTTFFSFFLYVFTF